MPPTKGAIVNPPTTGGIVTPPTTGGTVTAGVTLTGLSLVFPFPPVFFEGLDVAFGVGTGVVLGLLPYRLSINMRLVAPGAAR